MTEGEDIFPLPIPPHGRLRGQLSSLVLTPLVLAPWHHRQRSQSVLVCCPGRKQRFLSHAPQSVRSGPRSPTLVTLGSAPSSTEGGNRWAVIAFPLLMLPHGRQGGQGQFSCSHALRVHSPVSWTTGSALKCLPGRIHAYGEGGKLSLEGLGQLLIAISSEEQDQPFQASDWWGWLSTAWFNDLCANTGHGHHHRHGLKHGPQQQFMSISTMVPVAALAACPPGKHSPRWLARTLASSEPLEATGVTDTTTDQDMTLGSSHGQDVSMA